MSWRPGVWESCCAARRILPGAAAAYELVNQAPNPDPDILQKANLAAGEMYDLHAEARFGDEEI